MKQADAPLRNWWTAVQNGGALTPAAEFVLQCYRHAQDRMAEAERLLRPWVIRHGKPKLLPEPYSGIPSRHRSVGRAIVNGNEVGTDEVGIGVRGEALLPFLHDLCWNPSTLEQRTGRVDRIGAKTERCGQPIRIYLPYIAETQDEKMYRVVMDRERWFSVIMGEKYSVNVRTTDKMAERVPFPEAAASALALRLEVV